MLRHKKVLSYKYDANDLRSVIKDYTQSMHQHQADVTQLPLMGNLKRGTSIFLIRLPLTY